MIAVLVSCAAFRVDAGRIHEAAREGDALIIEALLTDSPSLVNSRGASKATPLHWAITYDRYDAATALIRRRADVNAQMDKGYAPLHCAAIKNTPRGTSLLLASGAKVDTKDVYGRTPLYVAEMKKATA